MGHLAICIMCKCEDRSAVPLNYFKQARPADESSLWSQCWRGQARHVPGTLNQQAAGSVRHSYLFKTRWTPPEEWHQRLSFAIHTHAHICACTHIPKYNLFSPYNATCKYVFMADCLLVDNQLLCSFLEKATSPIPTCPQLPIALYVELITISERSFGEPGGKWEGFM